MTFTQWFCANVQEPTPEPTTPRGWEFSDVPRCPWCGVGAATGSGMDRPCWRCTDKKGRRPVRARKNRLPPKMKGE